MLDKNHPACIELTLAASLIGAANVVVSFRLSRLELAHVLDDSPAQVVVVGAEFAAGLPEVRDRLPKVREVFVLGGDSDEYEKRLAAAEPVTRPHDHRPGGDPRRPARRHRENVYPAEVERVLMQHPDVAEVAVIGAALIAFTWDRLAHYKCPTSVSVVPALPRNPTGKVPQAPAAVGFHSGPRPGTRGGAGPRGGRRTPLISESHTTRSQLTGPR
jgi:acyl-CoA synthetase (AMP-forming)/AMP-acid ligase II